MVNFTCNHCGEGLRKPKVEKHYAFQCKNPKSLTCADCLKDFKGEEYNAHTKCMTEEERYAAKGTYVGGIVKKGEVKQESWIEMIKSIVATETNLKPSVKNLLNTVSGYSNVPRKKSKFINFIKNSAGGRSNFNDIEAVWDVIEKYKKEQSKDAQANETDKQVQKQEENGQEQVEEKNGTETQDSGEIKKKKKKSKKHEADISTDNVINGQEKEENQKEDGQVEKQQGNVEEENVTVVQDSNNSKKKKKSKKIGSELEVNKNEEAKANGTENQKVEQEKEEKNGVEVQNNNSKKKKKNSKKVDSQVEDKDNEENAANEQEKVEKLNENGLENQNIVEAKKKKKKPKNKLNNNELETEKNEETTSKRKLENEDGETASKKAKTESVEENGNNEQVLNGEAKKKKKKSKGKSNLQTENGENTNKRKAEAEGEVVPQKKTKVETAEENVSQNTFSYRDKILEILTEKKSIKLKKLQKQIVGFYVTETGNTENTVKAIKKFHKKLRTLNNVKIENDTVILETQ